LSDPVTTRSARVLLGNGDGSFAPVTVDLGTLPGAAASHLPLLTDFDGDRFPDLAASEYYAVDDGGPGVYRGVYVMHNDGNWTVPPPPPPTVTIGDVTVTEGNSARGRPPSP